MLEELQGDLYELFYERAEVIGAHRARWHFIYDVLKATRFFKIRKPNLNINTAMFSNYLTTAFRNLFKYKLYTFINITGLAIGIASFILIVIHVRDELSFDTFHEHADRIVRVQEDIRNNEGVISHNASTYTPLADVLNQEIPSIEKTVRLFQLEDDNAVTATQLGNPDTQEKFREGGLYFVDSTFFDVFTYPLKVGDPSSALEQPFSILLTEEMAQKYFWEC